MKLRLMNVHLCLVVMAGHVSMAATPMSVSVFRDSRDRTVKITSTNVLHIHATMAAALMEQTALPVHATVDTQVCFTITFLCQLLLCSFMMSCNCNKAAEHFFKRLFN